ncbi:MAG: peptidase C13, partial [Caulobacteraceae bacterium]|nr:peptidase C13 [Caulobacteraceae bacterium]
MRWLAWLPLLLLLSFAAPASAASPFADWAAVVVAGDFRGSGGGPTEAFDNARRDVAGQLVEMGFAPQNLRQFSTRPERYKAARPLKSDPKLI